MRRTRRLFLLALVVIVAAVAVSYSVRQQLQRRSAPPAPRKLNTGVQAASRDWVYYKGDGDRPVVEVRARDMERVEQPAPKLLLKHVQLKLYHRDGEQFDFVQSAAAEFEEAEGVLFSDGDVEITLGVPAEPDDKRGRLLTIHSSGVRIASATGMVTTDRKTTFAFDLGDGEAVGASYDPQARELRLGSAVDLRWRGEGEDVTPMEIQAGELLYKETESKVYLSPWSKFRRANLTLDAAGAIVTIAGGAIRTVDAQKAEGRDQYPNRQLAFGASELQMAFNAKSQVEKITGAGDARLESVAGAARTNIRTRRIDLDFAVAAEGSELTAAAANGGSVLETSPVTLNGAKPPPNRILRADSLTAKMRAGGQEIELVETHSPGVLELIPNLPSQPRRQLTAERMSLTYGSRNQVRSLRAVQVATRTLKPRTPAMKTDPPPALTWSRDLLALFDGESSELTRLEQWNDFRYQEGDHQATATRATLDGKANLITLVESARSWDPSGSVSANRIVLNQQSGDFTADGNVVSTRLPERKPTPTSSGSGMLSPEEPLHAKAAQMTAKDHNNLVVYQGDAVLWQSSNRLQAATVTIDRNVKTLVAEGAVVSQFLDQKPADSSGKRVVTVVRSPWMRYDDHERLAYYRGGVRLLRDGMDVKSNELRAWMKDQNQTKPGESSLDRLAADGNVEIFQVDQVRTRRGVSAHADYLVAEEKVVLNGGIAQMTDSIKGTTRGRQLTYFSRNDTLQVEGVITQPVVSRIRRN